MKTIKKHLKSVALILSMLIFFQGCTVYKSVPVSIEQAAQNDQKVKVITKSNEKLKFNRIGVEDGNYYGVKKSNGVVVKTPLDQNFINTIKKKDKTLSTILSIGIPLGIVMGVLGIIQPGNIKK
jgi:hypothetical protein